MLKFFAKGYSHGDGYTCKVVGLPRGEKIDWKEVARQLANRRRGAGRSQRMQTENDAITVLSGIDTEGKTDGSPLSFYIENGDNTLAKKPKITAIRSGHADLMGCIRLEESDARLVCELASARRTVAYTAYGAICKQILERQGIFTYAVVRQIGDAVCDEPFEFFRDNHAVENSDLRCFDDRAQQAMLNQILLAKQQGESIGGRVEVGCVGLPMGIGDFVNYEKRLDGVLAHKMMSIPSVKGVSFGIGDQYAKRSNGEVADKLKIEDGKIQYATNNCGGIVAGMTTGGTIKINLIVKAPPTTKKGVETLDLLTHEKTVSHYERSDVCVVPSVGVIAENILSAAILDVLLEEKGAIDFCPFDPESFDDNTVFVTDADVEILIRSKVANKKVFVAESGEKAKTLDSAVALLKYLAEQKFEKKMTVVAVGGGAVCDLAGFAAAVFKRGTDFVTVPTTLLAMVDAGVGGKNAVDFCGTKNMLGSFLLPSRTIIDVNFLQTNTKRHIEQGFGEIVKCALLSRRVLNTLEGKLSLEQKIAATAKFKESVVQTDMRDHFWRQQLNLGHTLGHAFEIYFDIPHGEAVLNGLYFESRLANFIGKTDMDFCQKTLDFLAEYLSTPIKISQNDIDKIIELCLDDKKNCDKKIAFVYAKPYFDFGFAHVSVAQLKEFLKSVC